MVTSPGGTTIRAIRELERAGVRAAFLNAIQAAMERSQELAEGDVLSIDLRSSTRRERRRAPRPSCSCSPPAPASTSRCRAATLPGPRTSWPRARARLEHGDALVGRRALRAARRRALELPAREEDAARPDRRAAAEVHRIRASSAERRPRPSTTRSSRACTSISRSRASAPTGTPRRSSRLAGARGARATRRRRRRTRTSSA